MIFRSRPDSECERAHTHTVFDIGGDFGGAISRARIGPAPLCFPSLADPQARREQARGETQGDSGPDRRGSIISIMTIGFARQPSETDQRNSKCAFRR